MYRRSFVQANGLPLFRECAGRFVYQPIEEYGIIGDSHTAALISSAGSVDWLCLPRFDSPSVFGALLDDYNGGRFQIRPVAGFSVQRRYVGETNVLETTFTTGEGVVRLTDAMAVTDEDEKRRWLWPGWLLIRRLECLNGEVDMEVVCEPKPGYARSRVYLHERGRLGFIFEWGANALALRSDVQLGKAEGRPAVEGRFRMKQGDRVYLCLTYALQEPLVMPPAGAEAEIWLERSCRWWEKWVSHCRYQGPYRTAVIRSALVMKLLIYAPSGALIAAPTTSLPERLGGTLNWDYRYCWLRDSTIVLRSLYGLGYDEEGRAFYSWLLHATQQTWPELRVAYRVNGEPHLPERVLDYLDGYAGSRPVRVGNDAARQLQLDVYGEVAGAALEYVRRGGVLDVLEARRLAKLAEAVCRLWREPDAGIWESRSEPSHHTLSRAMCWVALNDLLQIHQDGHLSLDVERVLAERAAIRDVVESEGYNQQMESYVSIANGDSVDASLMLMCLRGYIDAAAPRMYSTLRRILTELSEGSLVYRYRLDEAGGNPLEGAFGICSFWAVESLALAGARDEARARFEQLLGYCNDLGLFGEEIDVDTGTMLGNFPQAFTHAALIDAALVLDEPEP